MGNPPQPHDPYGQQYRQSGPQHPQQPYPPVPYQQQGYPVPPPYPAQQPYGYPQQMPPMQVQQVGRSVTKPAWTAGDFMWIIFTCGMALPFIWLKRRSQTTVTRHR